MKTVFRNIRIGFSILITKITIFILRLFGRGGTTLPGKLALKIYPNLFLYLSDRFRIIMITGTNGKTTTARIIEGMLYQSDIKFISNKSGANLSSGIATTLVSAISPTGKSLVRTVLLETDEGAFKTIAPKLKPEIIIVTNFFEDQVDRFGHVYATLDSIKQGILGTPDSKLILNADDSLCVSLANDLPNPVMYFGLADNVYPQDYLQANLDMTYCINCNSRYDYISSSFAHLGHFKCPGCGFERPNAQIECTQVLEYDNLSSTIEIKIKNEKISVKLALPGLYNIYNALAGAAVGHFLELDENHIVNVLEDFESGFGRMELIEIQDRTIKMILVKNPTGFNQVLKYLLTQNEHCVVAFLINDKLGDGTDISWLWDVNFEMLPTMQNIIRGFYASGTRAEDIAVRLKYAGIPVDNINIEKDYKELINSMIGASKENETLYLLPSYTAMLEIRESLKDTYNLKEFWE